MKNVLISDGSSIGNPGLGGYAYAYIILKDDLKTFSNRILIKSYFASKSTNNIMEMNALIIGLKNHSHVDIIYTDSMYLINGITKWIYNWKKNNWQTSGKKDVKNKDLWIDLETLMDQKKQK